MCGDCGFGTCIPNTSYCICDPPYSQSFEMYNFEGFDCDEEYPLACMPCDTLNGLVTALFAVALVANLLVFFMLSVTFTKLRRVKRHFFLALSFYCTIIAASIRIGDPNRWFAEDAAYTFFVVYGLLFAMIELMLNSRRFADYLRRTVIVQSHSARRKKLVRIILYTNYVSVVILLSLGMIPVVAAVMKDLRNKAKLVRPCFAISGFVFLFMTTSHALTRNRIISDMRMVILSKRHEDRETIKLRKTISKLEAERNALILVFLPTSILVFLFTGVDAVYRLARYVWPAGLALAGLCYLYVIYKGVRLKFWAQQTASMDSRTPSLFSSESSFYRSTPRIGDNRERVHTSSLKNSSTGNNEAFIRSSYPSRHTASTGRNGVQNPSIQESNHSESEVV